MIGTNYQDAVKEKKHYNYQKTVVISYNLFNVNKQGNNFSVLNKKIEMKKWRKKFSSTKFFNFDFLKFVFNKRNTEY